MTQPIYINEFDPFAAKWLGNLFPSAVIDQRSICDVQADDLAGYERCHFFGGIGGWELALKLAEWPAGEPVDTGSCPCQPFSEAGNQLGVSDPRHLWPEFLRIISVRFPPVVFGEQVASKAGREWLARVRADLEALGYAVGAADLCAAGEGAPHIRQRLFWVAYAPGSRHSGAGAWPATDKYRSDSVPQRGLALNESSRSGPAGGMGHSNGQRQPGRSEPDIVETAGVETPRRRDALRSGPWSNYDVVSFPDGKRRRIESGTFPVAHGVPNRVGLLRGYGNAINPWLAATFIRAFREATTDA